MKKPNLKALSLMTCILATAGFSTIPAAEANSGASTPAHILTIYPAGSSFKDIVLKSNGMDCDGDPWSTSWTSKHDIKLPEAVPVDGTVYEAFYQVFESILKNQERLPDNNFASIVITRTGCNVVVEDKA